MDVKRGKFSRIPKPISRKSLVWIITFSSSLLFIELFSPSINLHVLNALFKFDENIVENSISDKHIPTCLAWLIPNSVNG